MPLAELRQFNLKTRRKSDRYPVERNGVYIVKSGQFHYRDKVGEDITLNTGDFLLYSSGDISNVKIVNTSGNFEAESLIFDVSVFQKFITYTNSTNYNTSTRESFIFTPEDTSIVKLLTLIKEQSSHNMSDASIEFLILALLNEMVHQYPDLMAFIHRISVLTTSQQLIRYVEQNISADLTIDTVAPKLGMSSSTLKRKLQSDKLSFAHLVKVKRINYAATQLRVTRKTITEIAYETGFKTAAHFSTTFKSINGLTPKEFRESIQV